MRTTHCNILLALCSAAIMALFNLAGMTTYGQTEPASPALKRPVVADVIIQGNHRVPTAQIMAKLKTRPGAEYNADTVCEDVRFLSHLSQFTCIECTTKEQGNGRVNVYILVNEIPNVIEEVGYRGAKHLSQRELDELTGLRKGMPVNPSANRLACKAIVRKLNDDRRPFASCELLSGENPEDTKVIFNITEGPKVGLRGVKFVGNEWADSGRLQTLIQSKPILWAFPGRYHEKIIAADVSKIIDYYKSFGFLDVRVSRELELTGDGRDVYVNYHIQEGQRQTIGGPAQINGVRSLALEQLEQLSKLKAGQFYSQPDVDGDLNKIKDMIYHNGPDLAQAIPAFSRDEPKVVRMQFEVEEGPSCRVGQVFVIESIPTVEACKSGGFRNVPTSAEKAGSTEPAGIGLPLAEQEHLFHR